MAEAPHPRPNPERAKRYGLLMTIVAIAAVLAFIIVIVAVTKLTSTEPSEAPNDITAIDGDNQVPINTP